MYKRQVWGSPGSGKTTVAVKLAARLAGQKRDVALLLCDMNTPMLPCICPPSDLEEEHSLGSILAAAHVSESLVRHNCITHKPVSYTHLSYDWSKGDICVLIMNKAKKSTCECIGESYDGEYFGVRSHTD